jgi:hypothetical protein
MSFQNLVRLSQIKNFSLPDYAHVNKVSEKWEKNYNYLNGAFSLASKYDFDDRFSFARDSRYFWDWNLYST